MSQNITELPYLSDSCLYFERIRHLPWPIFLDSARPFSTKGRYDILTAAPMTHFATQGNNTTITTLDGEHTSEADPFLLLKAELAQYHAPTSDLPFNGGALGYFAYDLNKRLEKLPNKAIHDIHLPDMSVGIYLWAVIVDHTLEKAFLLNPPSAQQPEDWSKIKQQLLHIKASKKNHLQTPAHAQITCNLTQAQYAEKFAQIMHHIHQGDTYQINFAQRWQTTIDTDAWTLYQQLRQHNPAPFAAFIPLQEGAILSCSPERFLMVKNREVTTMPIKGTVARSSCVLQDEQSAQTLLHSEKNRAENVMIVDLMRNDLGKSCITGSVHVPRLCELQSFPNVHHLVSTVCGQLRADRHPMDLLRDCFPGGSITGAPKIRAMELIDDLEPHQRHIYCGSIGYIDFNGQMDTNIAIRTAVVNKQQFYFWGGGGIVQDSQMAQEYQETLDKVRPFFKFFDN